MTVTKFSISAGKDIKNYYDNNGYVVVSNLLNASKIDFLLNIIEIKKNSNFFVFTSQDTHLPMRPKLTPFGFMENSMLNPANLKFAPRFSQMVESCLTDNAISDVLRLISGASSHVMMQNMLFDKSTGTIEHQDHYYLDSNPPSNMIAAWYALEDIHEQAGCFFVLPKSHKGHIIERNSASDFSDHEAYRQKILALIEASDYEYQAFPLQKGDVLFWHPYTIHGADKNADPQLSRKSLTAHFYPSHLSPLYSTKVPQLRPSQNPNIMLNGNGLEPFITSLKIYLRFAANKIRHRGPKIIMRRENYKNEKGYL